MCDEDWDDEQEEQDADEDDTAPVLELLEDMDIVPDIDGLDFGIFG